MKKHLFSRMVVVGAVVMLMGFGVNAYAATDKAAGNPGMGAASTKLTDDQIKQMKSGRVHSRRQHRVFASSSMKKDRHCKTELAKQAPDAAKCSGPSKGNLRSSGTD